jgi:hypothetical protein
MQSRSFEALVVAAFLSACSEDLGTEANALADPEAVDFLTSSSRGHVLISDDVRDRLTDPRARAFAEHIFSEHNGELVELEGGSGDERLLADGTLGEQVDAAVAAERQDLEVAAQLDRRYLCGQVWLHRKLLGMQDRELTGTVVDESIAARVAERRVETARDLGRARDLVVELAGTDFEAVCSAQH